MNIKSLFCIVAALGMLASCGDKKQETAESPKYEIVTLKKESRTIVQSFPAVLVGENEVNLYPQVEGRVVKKHYQNGAYVRKGQVLLTIDPTPYRLQVESDEANVKSAEASLSSSKLQYESQQKLYEKKIVSEYVMKTAQNNYLTAQAQVAQAKAALSNSRTNLSHCTVMAPISGFVKSVGDNIGMLVGPNMQEALLTISDQANIKAKFSVNEALFAEMNRIAMAENKTGKKTNRDYLSNVQLRLKDGTIYDKEGVLKTIDGIIDTSTGTVTCEVMYENKDLTLVSGGAATVMFPITYNDVIAIPQTACKKLQNKFLTFKIDANGQAVGVLVNVQPTTDGKEYIVTDGALKAGDQIIASGVDRIQEGQKVK